MEAGNANYTPFVAKYKSGKPTKKKNLNRPVAKDPASIRSGHAETAYDSPYKFVNVATLRFVLAQFIRYEDNRVTESSLYDSPYKSSRQEIPVRTRIFFCTRKL